MSDLTCPYCGNEQDIDISYDYGSEEGIAYEITCDACDKDFVFYTTITYSYQSHAAECLNTGVHNYQSTITYPVEYTTMQCVDCDATRPCTEEEMKEVIAQREAKK